VTVVFCDVTGSTALGESTDPEALRALLARYFERMKGIVESHGGSVEKFIGDAVMAVFGVPAVHEDDALRACRAAVEMREALPELGVSGRIGVNTGEVVTGTEERLATGDAVNVAARLEQAARPGEVLIGAPTRALVGTTVEVEPVASLELKGKAKPVPAYRLLAVRGAQERRFATPMVGRENELARLRNVFAQAVHDRSCQLFTILGSAGVGKSRLVAEFLGSGDARVVRGRCLSYGEGITYWPVVEILKQLDTLPEREAARPLRSLLGESDEPASAEEIAWGFRKLLEQEAQAKPFVCVFDDVHWAEETLLDLVEHVADLSRDAPLLLLCMARPELLELRPSWGGGKWNATTVLLEPLDAAETEQLLAELGGVSDQLRQRIVQVAEGNPLFLEEMLALVRDSAGGAVEVPPTIQALLAARLDQLDPAERSVLERGSIEGRVFHRGAVAALTDGDGGVDQRLVSLVRKELVRPDRAQLPGDDAYRFRHLLIRDAAYDALPKATRADLHRRFAAWLEQYGESLVELDEILAYHYDQAIRYQEELGRRPAPELVEAARARLRASGQRAYTQTHDYAAAARAFRRALELADDSIDVVAGVLLADSLFWSGQGAESLDWIRAFAERCEAAGDRNGSLCARLAEATTRTFREPEGATERLEALVAEAEPELAATGDEFGLFVAARARAQVANMRGLPDGMARAFDDMAEHSLRAGYPDDMAGWRAVSRVAGTTPVGDLLAWMETVDPAGARNRYFRGIQALALAMAGRCEEAQARLAGLREELLDRGELSGLASVDIGNSMAVAELCGDPEAAITLGESACRSFLEAGELSVLSSYAPKLGQLLCTLGRLDEAEEWTKHGALGAEEDQLTQVNWRQAKAHIAAAKGDIEEATRLAREAVEISITTEMLNEQGDSYATLGEVLEFAGDTAGAADAYERALHCYERKGNLVSARRTRDRLKQLSS